MQYLIYLSTRGSPQIDYAARNEDAGILGSLRETPEPLLTADSHQEAVEKAYAHLGRNPADLLFLADSSNLLYEILLNRQYHRDYVALTRAKLRGWACFAITATSLVFTASLGLGALGLIICGAAISLFFLLVLTRSFNEIQAALACLILLVVAALLTHGNAAISRPNRSEASRYIEGRSPLPKSPSNRLLGRTIDFGKAVGK